MLISFQDLFHQWFQQYFLFGKVFAPFAITIGTAVTCLSARAADCDAFGTFGALAAPFLWHNTCFWFGFEFRRGFIDRSTEFLFHRGLDRLGFGDGAIGVEG